MMGWQNIRCFKVKWLTLFLASILFLAGILFNHRVLSRPEAEVPTLAIIVSIPFAEDILAANDPYFVALKLAFKRLSIDVDFVVLPGSSAPLS